MSKRIKSIPLNICSKFYNSIPGNFFILSLFQTGVMGLMGLMQTFL